MINNTQSNGQPSAKQNGHPNNQPIFQLHNAQVMRAGNIILDVDDFALYPGETVVVLGPNGSGKSTFIQVLTREILPLYKEEAPVKIYGQERIIIDDIRKLIGVVSGTMQDQITVHLPVLEIVVGGFFGTLGLPQRKQVAPEYFKKAEQALQELGIAHLKDRDMVTLSTGQARRVLVARSIIHNPDVLVFDEPCTGLDPKAMWQVRNMLSELAQQGRTLILVTHHVEDIVPEFKRVVLLRDAHILLDGPKREVLTTENLMQLFEFPLQLTENNGRYHIWESK